MPDFEEENKLWKEGFKNVAGIDEAGRGPLAGPVVAAVVACQNFDSSSNLSILKDVKDSKKLSPKKREEIYKILTNHSNIKWGIGIVSEKIIDKINILQATKLAMQKAIIDANIQVDYLLIDGNFGLEKVNLPQKSIIGGDDKVFSISAASIIAKVTRDKIMEKYHKKYPEYGFDNNKGYATKAHFLNITKFGPCQIHRKTFFPISSFIVN
jgi:ribonuclease HII